eukprot:2102160-Rhodomonas_salina.1
MRPPPSALWKLRLLRGIAGRADQAISTAQKGPFPPHQPSLPCRQPVPGHSSLAAHALKLSRTARGTSRSFTTKFKFAVAYIDFTSFTLCRNHLRVPSVKFVHS